jgi:hypothetical protein
MKIAALEQSWSTIVSIASFPSLGGRSMIKSIAMVWKGGLPLTVVIG